MATSRTCILPIIARVYSRVLNTESNVASRLLNFNLKLKNNSLQKSLRFLSLSHELCSHHVWIKDVPSEIGKTALTQALAGNVDKEMHVYDGAAFLELKEPFTQSTLSVGNTSLQVSQCSELEWKLNTCPWSILKNEIGDTDVFMRVKERLLWNITKDDVQKYFEGFNIKEVCLIHIPLYKEKYFVLVRFADVANAQKALAKTDVKINQKDVVLYGNNSKELQKTVLKKHGTVRGVKLNGVTHMDEAAIRAFVGSDLSEIWYINRHTAVVVPSDHDVVARLIKNNGQVVGKKIIYTEAYATKADLEM